MVWFYLELLDVECIAKALFQSHYGLILSMNYLKSIPFKEFFQSHYGLILSSGNIYIYRYDNTLSIPLWSDFIDYWAVDWNKNRTDFQSHYGLILSANLNRKRTNTSEAFNPTMVWFYRIVDIDYLSTNYTFNPTMVWFYLKMNSKVIG